MSFYKLEQLMDKWKIEDVSTEQAIGQILQHLKLIKDRLGRVEKNVVDMKREQQKGAESTAESTSKSTIEVKS